MATCFHAIFHEHSEYVKYRFSIVKIKIEQFSSMRNLLKTFLGLILSPVPWAITFSIVFHFFVINFIGILFAICVHLTSLMFVHYMAINLLDFNVLNILKYYSIAV